MNQEQPVIGNTSGQLTDQMLAPSGTTMPGHSFAPEQPDGVQLSNTEHTGNLSMEGRDVEGHSKRQAKREEMRRQIRKIDQKIKEMQQQNGALEEKGDPKYQTQEKTAKAHSKPSPEKHKAIIKKMKRQIRETDQQFKKMQQQNCTAAAEAKDSKTKIQKDAKQVSSAPQKKKRKHKKIDVQRFDQFLEDMEKNLEIMKADMKKAEEVILKKKSQNTIRTAQEQQD